LSESSKVAHHLPLLPLLPLSQFSAAATLLCRWPAAHRNSGRCAVVQLQFVYKNNEFSYL
jgi:hypothetical protein